MTDNLNIYVYGDSIMKAAMPDENHKYKLHINQYQKSFEALPVNIINRARFGACVDKGRSMLDGDLNRGLSGGYALLEYGGNDCNFKWGEISDAPEAEHLPNTELSHFIATLSSMADDLISCGIKPILMTLPPIDGKKYLDFLGKIGNNSQNILKWLGDAQMIYRFHELYSNAISALAVKKELVCVDIRSYILPNHKFSELISDDGIHPSSKGYSLIFGKLFNVLKEHLSASPDFASPALSCAV